MRSRYEVRIIPARAGFTGALPRLREGHADHPRSRGVYVREGGWVNVMGGSSPLARGLHPGSEGVDERVGIIPARAGFTRRPTHMSGRARDHPRSRGVYPGSRPARPRRRGSSPLARGLRRERLVVEVLGGIIPARAGFTRSLRASRRPSRDHPRSRGVYAIVDNPCGAPGGIIPARAGFPLVVGRDNDLDTDHPRSRGVYRERIASLLVSSGSSPLARGLLRPVIAATDRWRIIPARAGFTVAHGDDLAVAGDHPRSRGVYGELGPDEAAWAGSSPLARGLHLPHVTAYGLRGIIPARAGFTPCRRWHRLSSPDHPRSRGVYIMWDCAVRDTDGSSPLARGLRAPRSAAAWAAGIIPARAGFTRRGRASRPCGPDHPRSRGVYR